jgi:hypothetical protein
MTIREVDVVVAPSVKVSPRRKETGGLSRNGLDRAIVAVNQANELPATRAEKKDIRKQYLKMGMNGGTEADND